MATKANFTDQYLKSIERIDKKLGKATGKEKSRMVSKFSYADTEHNLCVDTLLIDKEAEFVIWDGVKVTQAKTVDLPFKEILNVPRMEDRFYRSIYLRIITPNQIIVDDVTDEQVDEAITIFLKRWILLDEEYYVIARNWIKQSWVYERFNKNPYLYLHGDWGTGKSKFGRLIMMLAHYGYVLDSCTAASLGRTLDLTNCSVMLEEADYIDGKESVRVRTMLHNGYERHGSYQVTDFDDNSTKNRLPTTFLVDQPKIIVKRTSGKDDALASRSLRLKMIPRDKDIPREMKEDVEYKKSRLKIEQARSVVNLLLKWRWQNIFGDSDANIVDDLNIRLNDTVMPILKVAKEEDKEVIRNFMRGQQRELIIDISDEYHLQIVKAIALIWREKKGLFTPTSKLYVRDIVEKCLIEYGEDLPENDAKRIFNSRAIRKSLRDLGFMTDLYRNIAFIVQSSLFNLLPRLCSKYEIPLKDEDEKEPKEEADKLLAEAEEIAEQEGVLF